MKIETDDLVLFGSLFFFGAGCGAAVEAITGNVLLSIGILLIAVSLPSAILTFMAAGQETK